MTLRLRTIELDIYPVRQCSSSCGIHQKDLGVYVVYLFENLFYFHLHVCLCLHKFMYVLCVGDLEAKRGSQISLELKLRMAVNCLMWVLGTELSSSGRVLSVLNYDAISPAA